jgi:hypothetical protein
MACPYFNQSIADLVSKDIFTLIDINFIYL